MNLNKMKELYEEKVLQGDELIIKNYKEMCKILNEEVLEGNSKKSQIKEWNRYFDFTRDGQKYIINDIYDKELPKNVYVSPFDTLNELLICERIIEHLENPQYTDKRYVVSMTELAYDLGYINEIFKQGYEHPNQLIEDIFDKPKVTERIKKTGEKLSIYDIGNKYRLQQLQDNVVYDCYNIIPKRYKDRINKTLKRLEQQCVINVSIINFGTFVEPDLESPVIEVHKDQYGDKKVEYKYKTKKTFRELTDKEDNLVQTIKNQILTSLNCVDMHDLYKYKKIETFNSLLQTELLKYGIASVKKCYVLAFAEDYIYQKRDNVKEKQRELNKLFLDKSLRNSYAMREKRIKQAENDPITAAEDKPKIRKYFTKEQEKRDQVLKYILSI